MSKMVKCPECNSIVDLANGACSECGYPFDNVDELEIVNDDFEQSENQRLEAEKRIAELERQLQAEKEQLENLSTIQYNNIKRQDTDSNQTKIVGPKEETSKSDGNYEEDNNSTTSADSIQPSSISEDLLEQDKLKSDIDTFSEQIESTQTKNSNKKPVSKPIIIGAVATIALIALVIVLSIGKPVESIELENQSESVSEGYNLQLKASILPEDAKNKNLAWSSSDENIATVDSEGIVSGVKPGECIISVQSNNKKEATCKITVGAVPQKIDFEKDSYSLTLHSKKTVNYKIEPDDVLDDSVTWKSSDNSIVSVDAEGQLTANKSGSADLTITTFNGVSDTCKINVYEPTPTPKPSPTPVPKSTLETCYEYFCDPSYAKIGSDGSYLLIDTKPNDNESSDSDEAIQAIATVLYLLDFPESVVYKMDKTNALAGVQSEVHNNYKVTWTYHPNNGLEALFEQF